MDLKPDIALVDDAEAAQMRKPVGAAEAVGNGRWGAVAMTGLVRRQHPLAKRGL